MTLSIDKFFDLSSGWKTPHNYHLVTFRTACRLQLFAAMRPRLAPTMPPAFSREK
jgi:hypothetical protein